MTVCRYYLQGTCRFGNRCRFEHVDPDNSHDSYSNSNYSNRKNDYGYQDRYRPQENYQDRYGTQENYQDRYGTQGSYQARSNKYENPEQSFGPRRYNNYEKQDQIYKQEKSNQYDNYGSSSKFGYDKRYHKDDYGRSTANQRYSSPERQSSNSRYDSSFQKSQFQSSDYSNKLDKSQYEWVSDDYKKQHQKKEQSYHETARNQNFDNTNDFSFKAEDTNEENMILAERVKEDVTAWELGNQWPFTCYSPLPKKKEFPGFSDISFEELRYEALMAKESNTFDSFVENVAKAILDVQNRRNKLKQPTENLLSIIEKLRAGEDLSETTVNKDGFSVMSFTQTLSEDIADEAPLNTQSSMSASSFSFKTADTNAPFKSSASFSFKAILDPNTHTQSTSSSSFSFKLPDASKIPISKFSSKETGSDYPIYTPIEQLSEQDKEQFSASTFILGKIPTVPPPKVLCF